MNRDIFNVILGGVGTSNAPAGGGQEVTGEHREINVDACVDAVS
jgi:NAD/NADP transhydrogenase beta subunit